MNAARPRIDRREAIKWMLAALAASTIRMPGGVPSPARSGYGTDPALARTYSPGELWPRTFTEAQHRAVTALCDVIIPAVDSSPGAVQVGVPDFIDEWISAPYPDQQDDRTLILRGLEWLDAESRQRHRTEFAALTEEQRNAIIQDICHVPDAKPGCADGARFFKRFRDLVAGGFYTTPEGMKDIGYVGNTPMAKFDGPPFAVLAKLDLTA